MTTATVAGADEDSAEFSSLATGDFEIVQVNKAIRPASKRPPPKPVEDDDNEETTELTNLETGDFESIDPRAPKR